MKKERFKINITQLIDLDKLVENQEIQIKGSPTEHIVNGNKMIMYNVEDTSNIKNKFNHNPGIKKAINTNAGIKLIDVDLRIENILDTITNTKMIKKEITSFFKNLSIYKKLDQPLRRSMLLYSIPGCGKTVTINKVCQELIEEDPKTLVIIWDTANISATSMSILIGENSEMNNINRTIIIAEDIGGGSVSGYSGPKTTTADMLEFLSGTTNKFKKSTYIVCTTNHPENLISSLSDRPGRIDVLQELLPPDDKERVELVKFIAKRDLTEEEIITIKKECKDFTIAYLTEVVVRSEINRTNFKTTIQEIKSHKEKIKKEFQKAQARIGL